jgi:hypothetical protein
MNRRGRPRASRNRRRTPTTAIAYVIAALIVIAAMALAAFTASVNFSSSPGTALDTTRAIAASDLEAVNCAANLTQVIHRIVDNNGNNLKWDAGYQTSGNQMWLGNNTNQRIGGAGTGGQDCLVSGGNPGPGSKQVRGGAGADYCYSGPGPSGYTFNNCSNGVRPGPPYVSINNP